MFDALIIGSGFGGAFAADALVEAGMRVALVERGPWRDTAPVRAAGIDDRSPLPRKRHALTRLLHHVSAPWLPRSGITPHKHGLLDVHFDHDMTVVSSSGVGGCSHVYLAVNTRPTVPGYWDNRATGIDATDMERHYDAVIARMGSRAPRSDDNIPNFVGDRYADDANFNGGTPLEQPAMGVRFDRGSYQDNSFLGSTDGSKVTLDALLIAPAMQRGLVVLDLHEATTIDRTATGAWRVTLRDYRNRKTRCIETSRLLLAAGTLGTLRLLFANRARGALGEMPALGRGFSGNGDTLGWWARNDNSADYSLGTPCHGIFTVRGEEDGPELVSCGLNGIDNFPLPSALRTRMKRDIVIAGMAPDQAGGHASWHNGRLKLHYSRADNPVMARIQTIFDNIARLSGKPVYAFKKFSVTVHPIGGARINDNPARGVINGHGEVHGLPGLYIVDASALPAALGAPPSMSVAAWARHVAQRIAHNFRELETEATLAGPVTTIAKV